jgi:hypothetical protein
MISSSCLTWRVKAPGPRRRKAEDGVGTVIERVERGDHAAAPDPDEAGAEEIS